MARMLDGLYKRGGIWWIRTDPVTGKPRTTHCKDREAARLYRAQRERLAADPAYSAAQTARLDEWIARVIATKGSDGSSAATVEVYRTKLGHWLRLFPEARLCQVDPSLVDAYVAQRRTEDVTDHTISKEVTHLCTVLKAAKRAGRYSGDIATLRPPDLSAGYKPRKRALNREEVVALMEQLKPELAALVAICVALGCRLSEAYRLQPTDIGAAAVHIRGTKTDEANRFVPILSIFAALLRTGAKHLPLGAEPNNLRRDLAAACARAGIAVATPNDLRRTHATLLAEAGVDRDVTRRLLGHTTTRLVDTVYGQPTTEALGALAEAKLLSVAPLQKRYSDLEVAEKTTDKHRADFEIRTRDLRFTKPTSPLAETHHPTDYPGFSRASSGERGRTRPYAGTDSLQPIGALALALAAERVLRAHVVRVSTLKRRGRKGVA
jgi:integrase